MAHQFFSIILGAKAVSRENESTPIENTSVLLRRSSAHKRVGVNKSTLGAPFYKSALEEKRGVSNEYGVKKTYNISGKIFLSIISPLKGSSMTFYLIYLLFNRI